jgi:indole-3-glycerol phosphate synthase
VSILRDIVQAKRERLHLWKRLYPLSTLRGEPIYREERRSLASALRRAGSEPQEMSPEQRREMSPEQRREMGPERLREVDPGQITGSRDDLRFLCEIKRASPSAGWIREHADAPRIARLYAEAGASGISLLTEEQYFRGRLDDLPKVREVGLPVLMKDFFIDPFQVELARGLGADAILLIAALGDAPRLAEIRAAARELRLEVLVEVHDERECELSHRLDPELAGVNNRNLATFEVDLAASERLRPLLPASTVALSESGISTRADVVRLGAAGFDALLVGESLMRAGHPGDALRLLRGASPREA